jgi:hypothetical protein
MKPSATIQQAQWALANKIAGERRGRKWTIAQTESGWYFIRENRNKEQSATREGDKYVYASRFTRS